MATARPTQVTIAGWVVIGASLTAVVMAFSEVARLHSLDTRQEIDKYISGSTGSSVGLGVQDVLLILRVASTVAAACAAATGILGWYVLRRSRGSRLALSIIAVPLFAAGLVSGGVAAAVVAAAAAMLWLQPARAWFDGVELPGRPVRDGPRPPVAGPPASGPPASGAPASGPTTSAWPAPPSTYDRDALLRLPPPTAPPLAGAPQPFAPAPQAALGPAATMAVRRPVAVVWACLLTWTFSSMAFVALAVTLAVTIADSQAVLDQAHQQNPDLASQGVSDTALQVGIYSISGVVLAWTVVAAVLAALAWRRVRWAAIGLLVSTIAAGGLGLLMVLGSVVLLVPVAACATTVVLLLRPEVRAWYAVRR